MGNFRQFGERFRKGLPAVLQASEQRDFTAIQADTPVKTGYMRDHLRKTSDAGEVTDRYEVFWDRRDFEGQVSRGGNLIEDFPPEEIILGLPDRPAEDMMTPNHQANAPELLRDLGNLMQQAARGR